MPELPEVETIRCQLEREIVGQKIKDIIVTDARVIKGVSAQKFKETLIGQKFNSVSRRGKVLILKIKSDLFLVAHLRLTGVFILSTEKEKFSKLVFVFSKDKHLHFCDSRVFGELRIVDDWQKLPIIKEMGPEPLSLTKAEFIRLFTGKKTKIKPLLMDQHFLAGVGNIYAQECLFFAGIHPERTVDSLSKEELSRVYVELKKVLKKAIQEKGSSVDSYRDIQGQEGRYAYFHQVYQRDGKPCLKCKTIIQRKVISGRGTGFCPTCQK